MTSYITITDYTAYLAGKEAVIDTASFDFYAMQATMRINNATFNRIETVTDNIKYCCCEVAEILYKQDNEKIGVAAEKVGGYSVNFESTKDRDLAYSLLLKRSISNWLWSTGLLYCGV